MNYNNSVKMKKVSHKLLKSTGKISVQESGSETTFVNRIKLSFHLRIICSNKQIEALCYLVTENEYHSKLILLPEIDL